MTTSNRKVLDLYQEEGRILTLLLHHLAPDSIQHQLPRRILDSAHNPLHYLAPNSTLSPFWVELPVLAPHSALRRRQPQIELPR